MVVAAGRAVLPAILFPVLFTILAGDAACNGGSSPGARAAGGAGGDAGGGTGGAPPPCLADGPPACALGATRCSGRQVQTCATGSDGCPAWTMTAFCGAPQVCERAGAPTCGDVDWAEWPVPNSPADPGSPNSQSFTDNGDGTVTDDVTQLMWQRDADPGTFTLPQALGFCQMAATGGYHDWRLPSQIELLSLVDYAAPTGGPAIDAPLAASTAGRYWSATANQASTMYVWGVDFDSGAPAPADQMSTAYARCVR